MISFNPEKKSHVRESIRNAAPPSAREVSSRATPRSGLTIAQAAQEVQLSTAALQRMETGRPQKLRKQDVRELCELYDVEGDETGRAIGLAAKAADNPDITALGGYVQQCLQHVCRDGSRCAEPDFVPRSCAGPASNRRLRAALIGSYPGDTQEEVDGRVEVRLKRQKIVTRKSNPVQLEVLLSEARSTAGSSAPIV